MTDSTRACVLLGTLTLGAATLGTTAGFLIAVTSDSSQVPAAVVAGLLAGLLGWLYMASGNKNMHAWILVCLVIIVFCGSLFIAQRETIEAKELDALEILWDRRVILEWCSKLEFDINQDREKAGLPPLSPEFVCGFQ